MTKYDYSNVLCQFLVLRVEKQYRNIVPTGAAPPWKPMTQSSEYRGFVLRLILEIWRSAVTETAECWSLLPEHSEILNLPIYGVSNSVSDSNSHLQF